MFVVKVQVNKWLLAATDTKEEAEQIVWTRVNSDKIDFDDGQFIVSASPCASSKKDEVLLRQMTEGWRRETELDAKAKTIPF